MARITPLFLSLLIFLPGVFWLLVTFSRDEEANRRPAPRKYYQIWQDFKSSVSNHQIWQENSSMSTSELSSGAELAMAATSIPRTSSYTSTQSTRKKGEKKKILFYTSFFGSSDWYFGMGDNVFQEKGCPISECIITNNRTMFDDISGDIVM